MRTPGRHRVLTLDALLVAASPTISCVPDSFTTHVTGETPQAIVFTFYDSAENADSEAKRIVYFSVWKIGSAEERATQIWNLRGASRRDSIVYGATYDGLTEAVPSQPLVPEGKYLAEAWHQVLTSRQRSFVAFSFTADGKVVEAKNSWDFGPFGSAREQATN